MNRLAALSDYSAFEDIPYGLDKLQHLSVYRPENLSASDAVQPATIIFFFVEQLLRYPKVKDARIE